MKKIYSLICAVAISSIGTSQTEQTSIDLSIKKEAYQPKQAKGVSSVKYSKTTGAEVSVRYDPSSSLPLAHSLTISGTNANYGIFVNPVFVDSTVKSFFSTAAIISDHRLGVTFDPKSNIFLVPSLPVLTSTDAYLLDTVWIAGVYQRRKNNFDDTLVVEIVWGDTTNTSVYSSWKYASAPINTFGPWRTPNYTTVANLQGDQIQFSAPTTNKQVIKHILTKADSAYLETHDYLPIVLNGATGQLIPANNIVSCAFSFNSAGTHTNGAISYASSTNSLSATESGWSAVEYAQSVPTVTAVTSVSDGYKDLGTGKNSSFFISKKGRYGKESGLFATAARGAYYWGYWIDFSIRYGGTIGLNELESNGASLGQNVPNPFDDASTVTYKLVKDAGTVNFSVCDVTGRIVSSEKVSAQAGTHTIKLGSYAAGVYYYTLNVDGKTATKKMIAQ